MHATSTALALALLVPFAGTREELVFAPEVGSTLTKTFRQEFEVELVDQELVFVVGGEERDADDGDFELTLREEETVRVTDEYLEVEGGRATRLRRRFDELRTVSSQEASGPEGDMSPELEDGESALEATTVVFTWDADAEEYDVEFGADDEDAETDLLEDLEADADLIWFLPEGEVEVGDEWELGPEAFIRISSPVGDAKIVRESGDEDDDDFSQQFEDNLEGEVLCTLASVEEGTAVVKIVMSLETVVEQVEELGGESPAGTGTTRYAFAFELEGELVWDLEAGHARGLELAGDAALEVLSHQESSGGDIDFEVRSKQSFEGTLEFTVEVE